MLVKTDSSGNMMWNSSYGGASTDIGYSVVEANDGGYAMTGYTSSFGEGESDAWLIKTNETGVIPEFPSWIALSAFMAAISVTVIVYRRQLTKASKT